MSSCFSRIKQKLASNGATILATLLAAAMLAGQPARADYVGELETTKFFDQATISLIMSSMATGGLKAGQEISYYIQFTPTDNGGNIGGGGFVTDYIPLGTQVVAAQFVRLNSDGSFTQIAPPSPAAVYPAFVPMYSDTGIFYSEDSRTAVYPAGTLASPTTITALNGYALTTQNPGCTGISLPSTTHNAWDKAMVTKFAAVNGPSQGGTCTNPPTVNYSTAGLSPVAGPNTYLMSDSTGATGPWKRINYPGSMLGTATGTALAGTNNSCVGGTPTLAGHNLSSANPLPTTTTAVRFAAGKVTVGELFTARITLKLLADMSALGSIINNTEVFGGDISLDPGAAATGGGGHPSSWNQWRYHCPAVATSNSNLLVLKNLVGVCTGTGCTPSAVTAGVVPNAANLKLRYTIQYMNLGGANQTSLVLTDKLATGATYVTGSYSALSGTTTPAAPTGTTTLTFPFTPASLGPGAGGTIQYDVNVATAQADGTALINTAKLVSVQVPAGVTSTAIVTVSSQANLWVAKSVSPSTAAPGDTVTYTISIPNNGGTAVAATVAKPITVKDYLPTTGFDTALANRFSYVTGTVTARTTTAAGVPTTVTPTVTVTPPGSAAASEQVTFTLTSGTIPVGGKLTITFNATVGSSVPASATPYLNSANVWYSGGPGGTGASSSMSETIGTAPVTVAVPAAMSLSVVVSCVYADPALVGATCVPYTNGIIVPGSKIKYKLSYINANPVALNNVVLTDTIPPNTTFVSGTALRDGSSVTPALSGQVLTFPSFSAPGSSSGYISFDVLLGAGVTAGTDITNTGILTATLFPAGVTASVTTSVRNGANLQVTKTAAPSAIQLGGTVTYTITVTNTGDVVASGIKIYDELPYIGNAVDATKRFNFTVGSSAFATTDTAANKLLVVIPATNVPPIFSGYQVQANRQEILWTFVATKELAVGKSITLTYTATAGANVPGSITPYTSDVNAEYISAASTMYASTTNTAPVTIGALDHILIVHDGMAGVCSPDVVTLQACANTSCSSLYTGGVSVSLSPSTGWLANPVTIGASGIATASYSQDVPGTIRYAVTAQSVAPQSSFLCDNNINAVAPNVTTECDGQFSTYEFVIETTDTMGGTVAAGSATTVVAGRPHKMKVTTYRKQGTQCGVATNYQNNKTLSASYADFSGITPAPTAPQISLSGTCASPVPAGGLPAVLPGSSNVTLNFNNGVVDPFYLCTADVGKFSLEFKDNNPTVLTATTPTLTVRPFALVVSGIKQGAVNNPANNGSGGTTFAKAGTDFQATVGAYRWSSAADNNVTGGDGTPDAGATLAQITANGATPSYTWTTTLAAGIPYTPATSSDTPSGTGAAGTFVSTALGGACPTGSPNCFSSGIATPTNLSYSEVGSFTLSGTATNFLNTSGVSMSALVFDNTPQRSGVVGRFYPDHFGMTGSIATRSDLLPATGSTFAYMDEPMKLSLALTAYNKNDAPTQNYTGSFAKLDATTLGSADLTKWICTSGPQCMGLAAISGTTALTGRLAIDTTSTNSVAPSNTTTLGGAVSGWDGGTSFFTLYAKFARGAIPDGPYDILKIGGKPLDSDGVTLPPGSSTDTTHCVDLDSTTGTENAACNPGPTETNLRRKLFETGIRFGRLRLVNAYGSELLPIRIDGRAEYWDGTRWVLNAADALTTIPQNGVMASGDIFANTCFLTNPRPASPTNASCLTAGSPAVTLAGGTGSWFVLDKTTPQVGFADLKVNLDTMPWLRGFWSNAGSDYTEPPIARIKFGSPKAPYIYLRERY